MMRHLPLAHVAAFFSDAKVGIEISKYVVNP
jgi:hypothetical protein